MHLPSKPDDHFMLGCFHDAMHKHLESCKLDDHFMLGCFHDAMHKHLGELQLGAGNKQSNHSLKNLERAFRMFPLKKKGKKKRHMSASCQLHVSFSGFIQGRLTVAHITLQLVKTCRLQSYNEVIVSTSRWCKMSWKAPTIAPAHTTLQLGQRFVGCRVIMR